MFFQFSGPIRRSFRDIPVLETDRLLMRKILPKDEEDMHEYAKDPATSAYLLWEPHTSRRFTRAHILYLQNQYRRAAFFDWALILKESGKMIGTCGFTEIYEKEKRAEVGYVLSPLYHRRALAPEALKKVMEYGFFSLGLEQLDARFMEDNIASQKVLIKLGFSHDETKKESIMKRGKKQRIFTYSITKEEYLNSI